MRILIVEDEMLIALVAEDDLTEAGHEVVGIAATAERAVELATALRPDLALMDVRLASARDGIDTATEFRHRLGIPAILATGSMDAENLRRAASAAPLEWLVKPYTSDQLRAAVARAARCVPSRMDPPLEAEGGMA